jgi:aarF domain-containing kinase
MNEHNRRSSIVVIWQDSFYDVGTQQTTLIDFGATREYSKSFIDGYLRPIAIQSYQMGFLTGEKSEGMLRANKLRGFTVGETTF